MRKAIPTIAPALRFNFMDGGKTLPVLNFLRSSTATHFDRSGQQVTVPENCPSIDFSPATGEPLGLVLDVAKTNFLKHGANILNEVWQKTLVTVSAGGPNGLFKIQKSAAGIYPRIIQYHTAHTKQRYTFSCLVAAGNTPFFRFGVARNDGHAIRGYLDLNTKQVSIDPITANNYVYDGVITLNDQGGGIFRLIVTYSFDPLDGGGDGYVFISPSDSFGSNTALDDQYIYAGNMQLENSPSASSFVETKDSAVTRSADRLTYGPLDAGFVNDEYSLVQQLVLKETARAGYSSVGLHICGDERHRGRFLVNGTTGILSFVYRHNALESTMLDFGVYVGRVNTAYSVGNGVLTACVNGVCLQHTFSNTRQNKTPVAIIFGEWSSIDSVGDRTSHHVTYANVYKKALTEQELIWLTTR